MDARLYLDLVIMGRKIFAPTYSSVLGAKDLDGEWAMGEAFNTMDPSEITKAGGAFFCRLGVVRYFFVFWGGSFFVCVCVWVGGGGGGRDG